MPRTLWEWNRCPSKPAYPGSLPRAMCAMAAQNRSPRQWARARQPRFRYGNFYEGVRAWQSLSNEQQEGWTEPHYGSVLLLKKIHHVENLTAQHHNNCCCDQEECPPTQNVIEACVFERPHQLFIVDQPQDEDQHDGQQGAVEHLHRDQPPDDRQVWNEGHDSTQENH